MKSGAPNRNVLVVFCHWIQHKSDPTVHTCITPTLMLNTTTVPSLSLLWFVPQRCKINVSVIHKYTSYSPWAQLQPALYQLWADGGTAGAIEPDLSKTLSPSAGHELAAHSPSACRGRHRAALARSLDLSREVLTHAAHPHPEGSVIFSNTALLEHTLNTIHYRMHY